MRRALVSIAPFRYQRRETTQVAVDGSLRRARRDDAIAPIGSTE